MITHRYLKNVVTLAVDTEKCNGCRMCVIVCPHRILSLQNKKAVIIDKDRCMECGACMKNCAANAIKVRAGVGCATGVLNSYFNKSGTVRC